MPRMTVNRDVNLGTLVPIALWLIGTTLGGIWWASNLSTQVEQLTTQLSEFQTDNGAENLRQWARINGAEISIQQINTTNAALNQQISGMRENLLELRFDIRQNNELLRDVLTAGGPFSDQREATTNE